MRSLATAAWPCSFVCLVDFGLQALVDDRVSDLLRL